ncbi:DUF411 domain-containing protein [Leucothrix arctica]|nr:DUF411 domain-containing protein [Leucothrix arctica]
MNTIIKTNTPALLMSIMISVISFSQAAVAADEAAAKATPEAPALVKTETVNSSKHKTMPLPLVTVYKSATCGCCNAWIEHMKDSGFPVEAHNSNNLNEYKIKAKLGAGLGSCHTAFVDGYAIEGHVPASDVKRLLAEKPDISGLTAPGMPMQSPGMAPKGSKPAGYDVISFKDGKAVGVFTKY